MSKKPTKPRYVTSYVHYRTGKLMVASKYGYRGWPFGPKR